MSIKVFTGPMKSGKSEEMLRLVERKRKYAKKNVLVVKPDIDKRFDDDGTNRSRDNRITDCTLIPANNPEYILSLVDDSVDVVAIDEAQFFLTREGIMDSFAGYVEKQPISWVVQQLHDRGYEVLVAGLNMTSDRKPFNDMPNIMAIATKIFLMEAVCEFCGNEHAAYSYADFDKHDDIALGDAEYKACCHKCYMKKMNEKI